MQRIHKVFLKNICAYESFQERKESLNFSSETPLFSQ
nr:MAG TPA: hypothetical protein [Caudoviricetes sp.]